MKNPNTQSPIASSAGQANGSLSVLLLCVGLVVSLFGLSLVPSMDLEGVEIVLAGYLFVVPGAPYFLLAVAARHLRSERDRRALIGAFAGVLPTLLLYAPLLQEHPRGVDGPLAAGMFIYWLPLVLPVAAGIGVASALLWPTRTRASDPAGGKPRRPWAWTEDPRPVAWRSSFLLAALGIVLGAAFSITTWLADLASGSVARIVWAVLDGAPPFAMGLLALVFRRRRAFYGFAGAIFGSLSAPLGEALMFVDSSDYRGGGVNFSTAFLAYYGPLFVAGMMALCSVAGRRWYRLQSGEPGRSLLASD